MCCTYKNIDFVSKSNREAEEEAKKEGEEPHIEINHQVLCDLQKQTKKTVPPTERQIWENKSAIYNAQLDLYE